MRRMEYDFECLRQRVFAYRMANGMSQQKFADAARVSYPTINKLERGAETLSKNSIYKIEQAMKEA